MPNVLEMHDPVRCRWCRRIYDLGKVEVVARYADCSVWKCPHCGNAADDRGETGWKTIGDYTRIDKNDFRIQEDGRYFVDANGFRIKT